MKQRGIFKTHPNSTPQTNLPKQNPSSMVSLCMIIEQEAIQSLARQDSILAPILSSLPVPQIDSTGEVFYDLMSCILDQQIHYRSHKRMLKKMTQLLDHPFPNAALVATLDESVLKDIKISQAKYNTLMQLCLLWEEKQLDQIHWEQLSEEEIRAIFSSVKGIGPWTMDMILLYTLGRMDIFPYDDFHVKEAMVRLYGLNPKSGLKAQMLERASLWKPYRSIAVLYLLDWKMAQKKIKS